ncbi:helix-turn-helix domain-containing protein [Bacillus piscicola]|uniref:helix-turn-helix domain-containing protein n=1 Tax=Bacillus piscicola TaxID=1632684 RepID=UPI001F092227|nr:helix-turn-helix domain-containing protein [Bacillus piscicola]
MMRENLPRRYVTAKKLQELTYKSSSTINRWIKNEWLHPINLDTYKADGGYVFDEEEVERFLASTKRDLSLKEAAEYMGITPQYLSFLRKKGEIEGREVFYGKQKRWSFSEKDCEMWMDRRGQPSLTNNNEKPLFPYANGYRLFHVIEGESGQHGRVIQTTPPKILQEDGSISTASHYSLDYEMEKWPERAYVRNKGFTYFRFPIPRHPLHPVYSLLNKLLSEIGIRNVKVFEEELGNYLVRVRNTTIDATNQEYQLLNSNLIQGHVKWNDGRVSIYSDNLPITVYLSEEEKRTISMHKPPDEALGSAIKRLAFHHLNNNEKQEVESENIRSEIWWELVRKNFLEGYIELKKVQVMECIRHRGYSQKFGDSVWEEVSTHKRGYSTPRVPYLLDAFLYNNERILMDQEFEYIEEKVLFALIEHIRKNR